MGGGGCIKLENGVEFIYTESAIVAKLRASGSVFAEDEARLILSTAQTQAHLAEMVERRVAGLPLEQVLGWAEFCGLRILVEPSVFVPRRRTEFLVGQVAKLVQACREGVVVVDLCCGSGAVGMAVADFITKTAGGDIDLHAVDIDPAAVQCARRNIAEHGRVYEGDLYSPLPTRLQGRVDILVANTPYVPTNAIALMPHEAREHEPLVALDGGLDGLDVQRRVAAEAPLWLAPGGHLLVETSARQAPVTEGIFKASGLRTEVVSSDELGATVVVGTKGHC